MIRDLLPNIYYDLLPRGKHLEPVSVPLVLEQKPKPIMPIRLNAQMFALDIHKQPRRKR